MQVCHLSINSLQWSVHGNTFWREEAEQSISDGFKEVNLICHSRPLKSIHTHYESYSI